MKRKIAAFSGHHEVQLNRGGSLAQPLEVKDVVATLLFTSVEYNLPRNRCFKSKGNPAKLSTVLQL